MWTKKCWWSLHDTYTITLEWYEHENCIFAPVSHFEPQPVYYIFLKKMSLTLTDVDVSSPSEVGHGKLRLHLIFYGYVELLNPTTWLFERICPFITSNCLLNFMGIKLQCVHHTILLYFDDVRRLFVHFFDFVVVDQKIGHKTVVPFNNVGGKSNRE